MKLAVLQMQAVPGDTAANLARIERAMREAGKQDADLLVTPELAVTGYGAGDIIRKLAEKPDGEIATRLHGVSLETGVAVIAGFAERDGDAVYNSAMLVDRRGVLEVYRKSHLYGAYERDLFTPEKPSAGIVEFRGIKLGMLICYDVEFPENVRRLALAGARAVLVPTALPASDHAALIARKMIAVRAFENQIFVAYVNHCGADERFAYAGLTGIAAPDGSMLAEAGETGEELLFADLKPEDFAASAAENTYLTDLRT
jgi:predicted amidohydrolase